MGSQSERDDTRIASSYDCTVCKLYSLRADVDESPSGANTPICANAQARGATCARSLTNKLVDSLRLVMILAEQVVMIG